MINLIYQDLSNLYLLKSANMAEHKILIIRSILLFGPEFQNNVFLGLETLKFRKMDASITFNTQNKVKVSQNVCGEAKSNSFIILKSINKICIKESNKGS